MSYAQTDEGLPVVKDSGTRRDFSTGSRRDSGAGKGRWDLLPYHALLRVARQYEAGARKYGEGNWEKGQPFSVVVSSAIHHLMRWKAGLSDEDHLAAAAWNVLALLEYEAQISNGSLPASLRDLPAHGLPKAPLNLEEFLEETVPCDPPLPASATSKYPRPSVH